MTRCPLILVVLALGACTAATRVDQLASEGGLIRTPFRAGGYDTLIYMRHPDTTDARSLVIFLEGDGRLRSTSLDPFVATAPENPIALELALRTPARVAYIVRPCHTPKRDPKCDLEQWRTGRYSSDIVAALVESVREAASRSGAMQIELVGYSGGGTLAVLVAERLDNVVAVVTVAANLDTDTWARDHDYPALSRSLNPASSERSHPWPELHLRGDGDQVVPRKTVRTYFEHRPGAREWSIEGVDHTCCWVERWPELWPQIEADMRTEPATSRSGR